MCGRSSLTKTEKEIEARFNATFYSEELERYNPLPNYNVAPSQLHPIITLQDQNHLRFLHWGLVPAWSKKTSKLGSLINARKETLQQKSVFSALLNRKRCLIPLDGFYEWKTQGKEKQAFRIVAKDQDIFSVAGLWDTWVDSDTGQKYDSFTLITLSANALMSPIHDRMPAILDKNIEHMWISDDVSVQEALALLHPYPSELMDAYEVSSKVNQVKNNDPTLIERIETPPRPFQTSLF